MAISMRDGYWTDGNKSGITHRHMGDAPAYASEFVASKKNK